MAMIVSYQDYYNSLFSRLATKSVDQRFLRLIEQGANCPPFVSAAILDLAKQVFGLDGNNPHNLSGGNRPVAGQMVVLGVVASEPPGKALSQCQLGQAVVTFDAGIEDTEVRRGQGIAALRRFRLARITGEARDQGILLSQEDLAYKIFNCGTRTIKRDIALFRSLGIHIPTRGQQKDIGPGLTHRAQAVRLFIERMPYGQIARRIFHSIKAVARYVVSFSRVSYLTARGLPVPEIAFIVQISERLVEEYQRLYQCYNTAVWQDRLREIVELALPFEAQKASSEGSVKRGAER
ncbi:MAG: hypothetical protein DRN21_06155 [Thermoplasmata archaeon]|nr:MAG: hypothetical protein DRN21_06155 [Thermoplasmata archaeon]